MRKTSYVVAFVAVTLTLILNVLTVVRSDWLYVKVLEINGSKVSVEYGLSKSCQVQNVYGSSFECRPFPTRGADDCDKENRSFCTQWTTAGYFAELGIGFAALALLSLAFGVSTKSRRRRIWRAVVGLVLLHATAQIITFGVVTDLYRTARYPPFQNATLSTAFALNTVSWVTSLFTVGGVLVTGVAADRGKHWAAGNRAYQQIEG